jgi:hypothetical protein
MQGAVAGSLIGTCGCNKRRCVFRTLVMHRMKLERAELFNDYGLESGRYRPERITIKYRLFDVPVCLYRNKM